MKFSSLQENLAEGLQTVFRAVPNKSPLPILSNIHIETEDGRVKLSATDLSTTITTYIDASVEVKGAITIPAKLLKDFITNLEPGAIDLKLERGIVYINAHNSKSKFNTSTAKDYPELPKSSIDNVTLEFNPEEFHNMVNLVGFASGNSDTRPIYSGTLLSYENEKLTIAATDGYRLSEKIHPMKSNAKNFSTIVPTKTMLELSRIFSKTKEPIKFGLSENDNQVMFSSGDTFVATRIIEGQYPPYKGIIPKEHSLKAEFDTQEFTNAVKLTSVFVSAQDGASAVKIVFDPENELIKVVSLAEDSGEHESSIPAAIEGDLTEIAFNIRYLLDFLNNVKSDRLTFKTSGNKAPCVLETTKHENFLHILMPIHI